MATIDIDYNTWTAGHWSWVNTEVEELAVLKSKFQGSIFPGQPLPPRYGRKLAALELLLELMDCQSRHIQCITPPRPGFRHLYHFGFFESGVVDYKLKHCDTKPDRAAADAEHFLEDPLDWCLSSLTTNPDAQRTLHHCRYFEFLDGHLSNATAAERARMDEALYRKASDLAAFNEMLVLIRGRRPRAPSYDLEDIRNSEVGRGWKYIGKKCRGVGIVGGKSYAYEDKIIQETPMSWTVQGQYLGVFIDTPPPQGNMNRRSWISQDSAQRRALSSFWEEARF